MADPQLRIVEYTDPGCPWAWSAEPFRRRLDWLYGDRLEWRLHMVGLSAAPEEYEEKGFTPAKMAGAMADISRAHHMPMATHERPRMAATLPACRAIVAAREHEGDRAGRALLRTLRIRHFAGELLDEPDTIDGAARDARIDPDRLRAWTAEPAVAAALEADMTAAREPVRAARILDHKLATWSGGLRYTCPSFEMIRLEDEALIAIPGFQPWAVYEVALANLLPGAEPRPEPASVEEVLDWAGEPLATQEVAAVMDCSYEDAREQLGRTAVERHLGFDGLWTLPRYTRPSMAPSSERASDTTASAA